MDQLETNLNKDILGQVVPIAPYLKSKSENIRSKYSLDTPITDKLIQQSEKLDLLSKYKSNYDWEIIRKLELRYKGKEFRGGIIKNEALKLINAHYTCQQCLYALEYDTYGRGCVHDCKYCYAKAQLTVHGWWNSPIPVPVNLNEIRKVLYTVFETDKSTKWRSIFESKIPLRIGSMSDSFMWIDSKYKVTQELLKMLEHYKYPYTAFTRSDLIARDDYLDLMSPELASIQFSISSTNDQLQKQIEPGAPSAIRRLKAIEKLRKAGFWTAVSNKSNFPNVSRWILL